MTTEYSLESLEPRTLLSATLSRHGVLYVVGTRHADNIVIYTDRQRRRQVVNVYVNHHVQTFAASLVRSVVVQAGGGNDRVTFTDHRGRVPGRHFIYGGASADYLVDDGGNDYIDTGGDANDTVYGGGGDDQIIGAPADNGDGDSSGPTTQPSGGGGGGGNDNSGTDFGGAGDDGSGSSGGGDFGGSGNSDGSGSDFGGSGGDSGGNSGGGSDDSGSSSGGDDF